VNGSDDFDRSVAAAPARAAAEAAEAAAQTTAEPAKAAAETTAKAAEAAAGAGGAIVSTIQEFLRLESASGLLLVAAAVLAILAVNSPISPWYEALLATPVEIRIGA
jgi:hypothetical protein